jgi:hypothetical protein
MALRARRTIVMNLAELLDEPESRWSRELALVGSSVEVTRPASALIPVLALVPQPGRDATRMQPSS